MQRFVVLLALLYSAAALANELPEPGRYRLDVEVSSATLPVDQTSQSEECLTEDQILKDPVDYFDQAQAQSCQTGRFDVADGRIALELECDLPTGKAVLVGEGEYDPASFTLRTKTTSQIALVNIEVDTTVQATRLGDCANP